MRTIKYQRGLKNTFYYIERDTGSGSGDAIMELRVDVDNSCTQTIKSVFSLAPRSVVALELDPDIRTRMIKESLE